MCVKELSTKKALAYDKIVALDSSIKPLTYEVADLGNGAHGNNIFIYRIDEHETEREDNPREVFDGVLR